MPETKNNKEKRGSLSYELKKVIWPTPAQTIKSTAATIGFVLLIAAVLIILNLFFDSLSNMWWALWN